MAENSKVYSPEKAILVLTNFNKIGDLELISSDNKSASLNASTSFVFSPKNSKGKEGQNFPTALTKEQKNWATSDNSNLLGLPTKESNWATSDSHNSLNPSNHLKPNNQNIISHGPPVSHWASMEKLNIETQPNNKGNFQFSSLADLLPNLKRNCSSIMPEIQSQIPNSKKPKFEIPDFNLLNINSISLSGKKSENSDYPTNTGISLHAHNPSIQNNYLTESEFPFITYMNALIQSTK